MNDQHSYGFVPFPAQTERRTFSEVDHSLLRSELFHGRFHIELSNLGPLLVADSQGDTYQFLFSQGRPVIPATTLKGVIRNLYEIVTASCLRLISKNYTSGRNSGKSDRLLQPSETALLKQDNGLKGCRSNEALCPACSLFGFIGTAKRQRGQCFKGRLRFSDALLVPDPNASSSSPIFKTFSIKIPRPYAPRPKQRPDSTRFTDYAPNGQLAGRKFYTGIKPPPTDAPQVTLDPLGKGHRFRFTLEYFNLSAIELAVLCRLLFLPREQAHRIGYAKKHNWGRCRLEALQWEITNPQQRYEHLGGGSRILKNESLDTEIRRLWKKAEADKTLFRKDAWECLLPFLKIHPW